MKNSKTNKKPQPLINKEVAITRDEAEERNFDWETGEVTLYNPKSVTYDGLYRKEDIKSACEFYLRYKDKPELLVKEHPELSISEEHFPYPLKKISMPIKHYNKWLFKLTFKDIFKEEKK